MSSWQSDFTYLHDFRDLCVADPLLLDRDAADEELVPDELSSGTATAAHRLGLDVDLDGGGSGRTQGGHRWPHTVLLGGRRLDLEKKNKITQNDGTDSKNQLTIILVSFFLFFSDAPPQTGQWGG